MLREGSVPLRGRPQQEQQDRQQRRDRGAGERRAKLQATPGRSRDWRRVLGVMWPMPALRPRLDLGGRAAGGRGQLRDLEGREDLRLVEHAAAIAAGGAPASRSSASERSRAEEKRERRSRASARMKKALIANGRSGAISVASGMGSARIWPMMTPRASP